MTHTPTPWRLEEHPMKQLRIIGPDTANGGELIVAEVGGHAAKQHYANAKLLVAAPDLLALLRQALPLLEQHQIRSTEGAITIMSIRAAIAKAESP